MNELKDFLQERGFTPIDSITNFITFRTGSLENSKLMYDLLLCEGVIIRPLAVNDMPEYVRVSIGNWDEMLHFNEAFDKILPEYNKQKEGSS